MFTLPAETPVTIPVVSSTVAFPVFELVQVPPVGVTESELVAPTQALVVPVTVGVPVASTSMYEVTAGLLVQPVPGYVTVRL